MFGFGKKKQAHTGKGKDITFEINKLSIKRGPLSIIWTSAPIEPLRELVKFYGRSGGQEPEINIPVVVIYNVKQLAAEIAKYLKEGSKKG